MSIYPPTKWYQDMSNLFITISESDLNNVEYEFQEDKMVFSASKKEQTYELTLNFYYPINTEKCILKNKGKEVIIVITKLEPQWWTFLVKEKKLNYIYVDWNGWKDEFDSDDELYDYKLPDNFHQMMEEMNNEMKNKN
jgi:hypothetical protein